MASTPQTSSHSRGGRGPATLYTSWRSTAGGHLFITMAWMSLPLLAVLAGVHVQWLLNPAVMLAQAQTIPAQAQVVDQRSFNGAYPCKSPLGERLASSVTDLGRAVWPTSVPPPTVVNGTQVFMPPGITPAELLAKPFHVYDDEFYSIIGENPTLTLIAEQATDPLYHEAVVW